MYLYFHENMLSFLVSEHPLPCCGTSALEVLSQSAFGAKRDRYVDGANQFLKVVLVFKTQHCNDTLKSYVRQL